jgi:hypothetical protein
MGNREQENPGPFTSNHLFPNTGEKAIIKERRLPFFWNARFCHIFIPAHYIKNIFPD